MEFIKSLRTDARDAPSRRRVRSMPPSPAGSRGLQRAELPERRPGRPVVADHARPQAHRRHVPRADARSPSSLGGLFAMLIRIELLTPGPTIMDAMTYNRMFTLHGVVMIFLFMIPAIPGDLRQLLPAAHDRRAGRGLPAPQPALRLPLPPGRGHRRLRDDPRRRRHRLDLLHALQHHHDDHGGARCLLGAFILGLGSIVTGLNFIVTIHTLRAPGITWMRLPLFVWAIYATSVIQVLATPVLGMTLLLVAVENVFGFGIFDPARGGDPVLFQHLFWFYSHPAVYIMVLPAMARGERGGPDLRPQEHVRLQGGGLLVPGHRLRRASSPGATTCSPRGSRPSTPACSACSRCSWGSSPPSRSSTGRPRSTRARSR